MAPIFVVPAELTRDDLLVQLATLQGKFANLAAIEQAKGVLMLTYGLSADAAFELLRFHSQTRNVKLRDLAAVLVSRLSTIEPEGQAIAEFDRLLDTVTRSLQRRCYPAVDPGVGYGGKLDSPSAMKAATCFS